MTRSFVGNGRNGASALRGSALVSAVLACLVLGCALPPAPLDHHYRLSASAAPFRFESPVMSGALRVKRPRADAFTDGTNLLYRKASSPAEIHRDAYQYWVDAPSLMLQDLMIAALREAGVADPVIAPDLRTPVDHTLASRLHRLEGVRGDGPGRAEVEIEISLIREDDRALIFQGLYAETEPTENDTAAATVEAFGRALDRILARFLNDLRDARDGQGPEVAVWLP
jgi:ABC-type uncharacterized transport system auxiliary subunit